jgi:hypothetical protein
MVRSAWLDFPDDFAPEPTVFNGGPDRQKQIWEACRAVNSGGYGSGCVQSIKSMGIGTNSKQVTSCSPFTATCIGMMFDTRPGVVQTDFEPMFDNGKSRLGRAFYQMHNGNYFAIDHSSAGDLKRTTARSQARLKQWADNKWVRLFCTRCTNHLLPGDVTLRQGSRHGRLTRAFDVHAS